jgi:hypothetical protein
MPKMSNDPTPKIVAKTKVSDSFFSHVLQEVGQNGGLELYAEVWFNDKLVDRFGPMHDQDEAEQRSDRMRLDFRQKQFGRKQTLSN